MVLEISFQYFMDILNTYGISTIFGPFLVIFSLTYGLLRKTPLFDKQEKLGAVIALAFSIYYISNITTILFTQKFFAMFFYEILVLLFVLMIIGLLGSGLKKENEINSWLASILSLSIFIAALYAYSYNPIQTGQTSFQILSYIFNILFNTGMIIFLVLVVLFIILTKWLSSDDNTIKDSKSKEKIKTAFETIADALIKEQKKEK